MDSTLLRDDGNHHLVLIPFGKGSHPMKCIHFDRTEVGRTIILGKNEETGVTGVYPNANYLSADHAAIIIKEEGKIFLRDIATEGGAIGIDGDRVTDRDDHPFLIGQEISLLDYIEYFNYVLVSGTHFLAVKEEVDRARPPFHDPFGQALPESTTLRELLMAREITIFTPLPPPPEQPSNEDQLRIAKQELLARRAAAATQK